MVLISPANCVAPEMAKWLTSVTFPPICASALTVQLFPPPVTVLPVWTVVPLSVVVVPSVIAPL